MVMRYWGDCGIIGNMSCKGYAEEFAKAFGTSNGSAPYDEGVFKRAFEQVAILKIDQLKYVVNTASMHPQIYQSIKDHMKHSKLNDKKSPWDRPGVIVISEDPKRKRSNRFTLNKHVILAWGCKSKEKYKKGVLKSIKISYKFKDPIWKRDVQKIRTMIEVKDIPNSFFALWWPTKC